MEILSSRVNQRLSDAIYYRSAAEATLLSGKTNFLRLVAIGVTMLGFGVALGIGFIGYSYVTRNTDQLTSLSALLSKALSETKLSGTVDGTVQFSPHELTIAKDQYIALDPKARVILDPAAKVIAEGEVIVRAPTISAPRLARDDSTKIATITNFTVFKRVPFDNGTVMTGWVFLTSAQRIPSDQYCYFTQSSDTPGLDVVLDLATNQKADTHKSVPRGFNIREAIDKCVWFKAELQ